VTLITYVLHSDKRTLSALVQLVGDDEPRWKRMTVDQFRAIWNQEPIA